MWIPNEKLPIPLESFMYIGETNDDFTTGKYYYVLETGNHFVCYLPREFGVHITYNDSPKGTRDPDYGCWIAWKDFKRDFKKY